MNITQLASGGVVGVILMACTTPITPVVGKVGATIPVKGQCGEFTCEELFQTLETQWPQQIAVLATECPDVDSYGLNVWEDADQKLVSLFCWRSSEAVREAGSLSSGLFRTFPYPGHEGTFLADNDYDCRDDAACLAMWQKLESKYPEEIRTARQTCAFRQGLMIHSLDGMNIVNIACSFRFKRIQVDEDGEPFVPMEKIDIPLGSFPLESLGEI